MRNSTAFLFEKSIYQQHFSTRGSLTVEIVEKHEILNKNLAEGIR